jgi:hypothetical protein
MGKYWMGDVLLEESNGYVCADGWEKNIEIKLTLP